MVQPHALRQPLALYGAGDLGRLAWEYFKAIGVPVSLVIDRDAASVRQDPFWQGCSIATPAEVPMMTRHSSLLAVCIATIPFTQLNDELSGQGWTDIVPFYDLAESGRNLHPLSNGWFVDRLDADELARTAAVMDRWHDDTSRAHHLQFLAWRFLRRDWTFEGAPVTRDDRFFIPEIVPLLDCVDVFVDAGAYHGTVTERFASLRPDAAEIIAIEPDTDNAAVFRKRQSEFDDALAAKTKLLECALDAHERIRMFHQGLGYASQLAETGVHRLETRTLDGLNISPDFVKLHLEGGELDALRGGIETLKKHRPILAVTTYHSADGIWQTPAFLMDMLPNYRFLMRLHSWCGTGAVVYALPEERL